ncbi:MAG: L,D-transpeptidase family protein [Actinobacteria bacterium]|nr:L,D-transpeptidase family protein [Actinomycetota bacterium]
MRCGLVCALALLIFVPAATGAAPLAAIQTTPATGPAPLHLTFTAPGDRGSYHWDFGDGTAADGQTVEHTYAAGRWAATLTSRAADGTTTTETASVTAYGLTLTGPNPARYDRKVIFRGAIIPAERDLAVALAGPRGKIATARTRADGSYVVRTRIRAPGSYTAASERASATPLALRIVPKLVTGFAGSSARGSAYYFTAHLVPSGAGTLGLRIARGQDVVLDRTFGSRVRIKLDTSRLTTYRITTEVLPKEGYAGTVRLLRANVVLPRLASGARSTAVARLGDQLRRLHYAAPYGLSFDGRMLDAVYAFQKVHGLPRTGTVDARFWQALANPRHPLPRFARPATHIEVNKGLQILYVVRSSKIALIVPISTAGVAGAFTPIGRFAVYRKVGGFDPSPLGTLYDPLYFTGGYAIHGNPSVPPYPASHGCVRVPMWVAPQLYRAIPYGETVYVY